MNILPNEVQIAESSDGTVFVSNFRIQQTSSKVGSNSYKSIFLDRIDSIGVITVSKPRHLAFAAVSILFSINGAGFVSTIAGDHGAYSVMAIGLFITAIFVVVFFLSRRTTIEIRSSNDLLQIEAGRISDDNIDEFINRIEQAMLDARINKMMPVSQSSLQTFQN